MKRARDWSYITSPENFGFEFGPLIVSRSYQPNPDRPNRVGWGLSIHLPDFAILNIDVTRGGQTTVVSYEHIGERDIVDNHARIAEIKKGVLK